MGDFEKLDREKKIKQLRYLKNMLSAEKVVTSYKRCLHQRKLELLRSKNASIIDKKRK